MEKSARECQGSRVPERARKGQKGDPEIPRVRKLHPEIFLRFLNEVFPEVFKQVVGGSARESQRVPGKTRNGELEASQREPASVKKCPRLPDG